jgi:hypothetical protein
MLYSENPLKETLLASVFIHRFSTMKCCKQPSLFQSS